MKYDIFISYKHTDEFGNETEDCKIARELFDVLNKNGYSTFYSSDSLEKLGSSRYKADIDAALDTAKIMIVVLTRSEYATSQWVQYEWDSFYNDYLSGGREDANLFTLTVDVNAQSLPRTLRNVQNFSFKNDFSQILEFVKNALPKVKANDESGLVVEGNKEDIFIISGKQVTEKDISQALQLDSLVYDDMYHVDLSLCVAWFKVNPDIYVMAKDKKSDKVIAYVNVSPITDECYERLRNGDFIDTGLTADMVLSYDMPYPYSVYFSSIVIHPDYQNTEVFMLLFNEIVKKFIYLGEHEVYVRRMIADAVTANGEKFCKLFGMTKVKGSNHNSTLYEICMIPPKFRILSKKTKELYDYYLNKYNESPYIFGEDI